MKLLFAVTMTFLKRAFSFIRECQIYVGRRPDAVGAPAIIFFPLLPDQLNCGFAGLMTCRLENIPTDPQADLTLLSIWGDVKGKGLRALLEEKKSAADYLGGAGVLRSMETSVETLKREDAQEILFFQQDRAQRLAHLAADMKRFVAEEEKHLEHPTMAIGSADLEIVNSRLLLVKDVSWMLEHDILDNFHKIRALSGVSRPTDLPSTAFGKYRKLNLLLNALDRLEVRGRDSAGLQLTFTFKRERDLSDALEKISLRGLTDEYARRTRKSDLFNQTISLSQTQDPGCPCITFTYKTFSIVGELGRNVSQLRQFIESDRILQIFAGAESKCETALSHTRWASVGAITEVNCHPVNNHQTTDPVSEYAAYPGRTAEINVVLNGDIDNYDDLRRALEQDGELISPLVTTDTKIIPLQIEKYLKTGRNLTEAFRLAVNDFQGSHAIAMTSNLEPSKMFLALKGSGQSIYVGVSDDQLMFSSELYGLVEVMPRFIKMNGETAEGSVSGQIFILDQHRGAGLSGISACFYDGTPLALSRQSLQTAEITTRDIDRSDYPHFFLKEISESALSIRRTLRGKYHRTEGDRASVKVTFNLGPDIVPPAVVTGLKNKTLRHLVVIGHGTAAVAGMAVADTLAEHLKGLPLTVSARVASELSGFGLKTDLSDTLVIPITQSGTTTDTNRAVAMARERGALVLSIVNRRQSDITAKSHGVFYTSDGRDIEMSVASTKAFYAQIVAGHLLALFFAQILGTRTDDEIAVALKHLESVPDLMNRLFEHRDEIAASVKKTVGRRYWAIVGSGPNKAAADEIRIKLSELCYRTISSDIVENKKHIDLSAEPLILVCASGNPPSVVDDLVKDVAIFKAHKSAVVVFADEGDRRFDALADAVIGIPQAPAPLPVILNTMAGHLWGYYAARAIDEEAQVFREFRGRLAAELSAQHHKQASLLEIFADTAFRRIINEFYGLFNALRQGGAFGALCGKTLTDLVLLLKYAAGKLPLQDIRQDFKTEDHLLSVFDLLDIALGTAIDELTRPIDAIRHQAKTVTVGTSRKEAELKGILFELLEHLRFSIKNLVYRNIRDIHRVQPAVASVRGYTAYDISGLDEQGNPSDDTMIVIRTKGGIAANMTSRADHPTQLMGTKRMIVSTGHIYIGKGKSDGVPIIILPLLGEHNMIAHLLLIHIDYNESLTAAQKKDALGYRYNDIRNLVNEYNLPWDDEYLTPFSVESLFSEPIEWVASQIRTRIGRS